MELDMSPTLLSTIVVLVVWDLAWKGYALWKASKHDQKAWFIIMLLINSAGILPIIYLLLARKTTPDSRSVS